MDAESDNKGSANPDKNSDVVSPSSTHSEQSTTLTERTTSPASGISSWGRSLSFPQSTRPGKAESETENAAKSDASLETKNSNPNEIAGSTPVTPQPSVFGSLTKGLVDSSLFAVKAFQLKARQIVSQNKRRYQVFYISSTATLKLLITCHFSIALYFLVSVFSVRAPTLFT